MFSSKSQLDDDARHTSGSKVLGDSFVVLDSFPLPVEGTETRVNAGASANEFMIKFIEAIEVTGRADTVPRSSATGCH